MADDARMNDLVQDVRDLSKSTHAFIGDTREFFGRVEKSFSVTNKGLQLQHGWLEDIKAGCGECKDRLAHVEADTANLISNARDQWTEINRLRELVCQKDEKIFSLWPPRIAGFGTKEIVILLIALSALLIVLDKHGFHPWAQTDISAGVETQ